METLRAAAVQAAPVWMNREGTVEKAAGLVRQAGAEGAQLVAFPETFVPGYPWWISMDDLTLTSVRKTAARQSWYLREGVDIGRGDLDPIAAAARDVNAFVSVGIAELGPTGGSLYCSMVMISPEDGVVGVHRKLKPTSTERVTWADGDGHGLRVHEWHGWRIGGLNCWENWLPLARYALYSQGEQLHIMSWPGFSWQTLDPTRFVAIEAGMYVVSSSGMIRPEDIPTDFPEAKAIIEGLTSLPMPAGDGGALICDPAGNILAQGEPGEEQIVYADLEIAKTIAPRSSRDQGGHYHRPDVFDLNVNRSRQVPISFSE